MKTNSIKTKSVAILTALLIAVLCIPIMSGCKADKKFTLKYDGNGDKYYSFSLSGYTSSLKGEYEIPSYYGEGEDRAPVSEIETEGLAYTQITKLTIPDTVTKIGVAAFSYNYNLREVVFEEGSKITELERGVFGYCRALESVIIPESVTSIGALAFLNCEQLKSATLPAGLKEIGESAFQGCGSLSAITLPEGLLKIGDTAFYNSGLEEVTVPDSVRDTVIETTDGEGKPVTKTEYGLGFGAFHSCTKLKKAIVGGGVTVLQSGAFGYCTALEEVYLPSSLKTVQGARYENDKLVSGHAFHNDEALARVYFSGSESEWNGIEIINDKVTSQGATYDNKALDRAQKIFAK